MMKWVHSFHLSAHRQFIGLCHCVSRLCRHTHTDTYLPLPPSLCYYMNLCMVWNKETAQQNMHFFTHKLNCVCFFIRALLNQSVWKKLNESYTTNGGAIIAHTKIQMRVTASARRWLIGRSPSLSSFLSSLLLSYIMKRKNCVLKTANDEVGLCVRLSLI